MRTNLLIAAWGGPRRNEKHDYLAFCPQGDTLHLQKQIACLRRYSHTLSQITIICPPCKKPRKEYEQALSTMPEKIRGAKVEILNLEVNSSSYGSWAEAVAKYRDQFDYYFFLEDDYVFVQNDFDKILIQMYHKKKCEYLLSYSENARHTPDMEPSAGAAITNGLIRTALLKKRDYVISGDMLQFLHGFRIQDFDAPYTLSPYFCNRGIVYFGEGEYMIVPTQMVDTRGDVYLPKNPIIYTDIPPKRRPKFLENLH